MAENFGSGGKCLQHLHFYNTGISFPEQECTVQNSRDMKTVNTASLITNSYNFVLCQLTVWVPFSSHSITICRPYKLFSCTLPT